MKLIDIGANLSNKQFENDLKEVISNSEKAHLKAIYLTTTDKETFYTNLDICSEFHTENLNLYTTWGLHPHKAKDLNDFIHSTEKLHTHSSIKAIGEFGLDFFRMLSTESEQVNCFEFFLDYSSKLNLPLFLHERQAHEQFVSIYKQFKIKSNAVVHCFTGNKCEAKDYLDMGFFLGVTGWICDNRRNIDLIEAVKYIPIDKILIETDSPYLKPRNIKQKNIRNEPKNLIYVLETIANIKNISIEEAANILYNNTINFFNNYDR